MELLRFIYPFILVAILWQWVKTAPLERERRAIFNATALNRPPSLNDLWDIVHSPEYVDECVFGEPLKDDCETCSKLGKSPEAYYLCCGKGDLGGVRTWCQDFLSYTLPKNSAIILQDR